MGSIFGGIATPGESAGVGALGAMIFIATYTLGGGADFVKDALVPLPLNPWLVLIIIQVILLFLGMVLDIIGVTVLLAPIFVPVY